MGGSDTAGDGAMVGTGGGSLLGEGSAVVEAGAVIGDAGCIGDCVVPAQAEIASQITAPTTARRTSGSYGTACDGQMTGAPRHQSSVPNRNAAVMTGAVLAGTVKFT